jgi:hypothetical protein
LRYEHQIPPEHLRRIDPSDGGRAKEARKEASSPVRLGTTDARLQGAGAVALETVSRERKMSERYPIEPAPELPDDTLISRVQLSTRIQNALAGAGLRTVGEVREASDEMLLSLPDLGPGSLEHLRETLGLPSCDGVRPRR